MARNLRYSVAIDEETDKALKRLAKRNKMTKSSYVYKIIKDNIVVKTEIGRGKKNEKD